MSIQLSWSNRMFKIREELFLLQKYAVFMRLVAFSKRLNNILKARKENTRY